MASNAEMLRLIQHAEAKLRLSREAMATSSNTRIDAFMSMAYAEAVLGMVASCVMPDDEAPEATDHA